VFYAVLAHRCLRRTPSCLFHAPAFVAAKDGDLYDQKLAELSAIMGEKVANRVAAQNKGVLESGNITATFTELVKAMGEGENARK
jgi:hypothetical protein